MLPKDVFTVQTTLASTKLTQNEGENLILILNPPKRNDVGAKLQIQTRSFKKGDDLSVVPER